MKLLAKECKVMLMVDNVSVIVDSEGQPAGGSLVFSEAPETMAEIGAYVVVVRIGKLELYHKKSGNYVQRVQIVGEVGSPCVVADEEDGRGKLVIVATGSKEHQCRVFPWSIGYNPKEEMTLVVLWISLPNLSLDLLAKKSLLSIASTIGKPIAIDKATQIKSRPSMARVKVILDLMEKLPNRIRLQFVDGKSGKLIEVTQEIVYDDLPLYCNYYKHQGHDEDSCRLISKRNQNNKQIYDTIEVALKTTGKQVKLAENDNDLIQEKQVSPLALNNKLSLEAPVFVPKYVIAKKNESRTLVSNTIDLGEDSLDEDEEDNMLDICFERVAREGDISSRK
ncbi:hypothetical protein H5410_014356 [Solanum commersonii]|uniref:DUF4283 domain-containing protein n=1 Tax=Solanum commersonii TaxID=4109 RepID=A0A9J5ZR63_SOLCO|nr:hypothetical protein H5410_014356 [Solanum commersonii]